MLQYMILYNKTVAVDNYYIPYSIIVYKYQSMFCNDLIKVFILELRTVWNYQT